MQPLAIPKAARQTETALSRRPHWRPPNCGGKIKMALLTMLRQGWNPGFHRAHVFGSLHRFRLGPHLKSSGRRSYFLASPATAVGMAEHIFWEFSRRLIETVVSKRDRHPMLRFPRFLPFRLRTSESARQNKKPTGIRLLYRVPRPSPRRRLRQSFQRRSLSSLATEVASQVMPMIRMIRSLPGPNRFDALNLKTGARHFVVKGKLCHPRAFFQNSGVSRRTTPS
jgi:hypothetical protein